MGCLRFVGYFAYILCGRRSRSTRTPDLYCETIASCLSYSQHFMQHLNRLKQKIASPILGRRLMISATRHDVGHFCLIFKQNRLFFVGAEGLEPPTSTV